MAYLKQLLFIISILSYLATCSQVSKQLTHEKKFDLSLITGEWSSTEDTSYFLRFDDRSMAMLYSTDSSAIQLQPYFFSGSCSLKDTNAVISAKNTYVVLSGETGENMCFYINCLDSGRLNWSYSDKPQPQEFKKVQR